MSSSENKVHASTHFVDLVWEVKGLAHIKCWESGPAQRQKSYSRLSLGSVMSKWISHDKRAIYGRRKLRVALQAEGGRKDRPRKGSASAEAQVGQPTRSKKFTWLTRLELLGGQSCRMPSRMQADAAWACRRRTSICRNGSPSEPVAWGGAPWRPC